MDHQWSTWDQYLPVWSTVWPDGFYIFQLLAFYINENLPKRHPKLVKVGSKLWLILNKRSKTCRKLLRFCQSGKISPNLVIQMTNNMFKIESLKEDTKKEIKQALVVLLCVRSVRIHQNNRSFSIVSTNECYHKYGAPMKQHRVNT